MERNKTIIYNVMAVAVIALSLTSCVKDELFDTPHPDHGKITVTADWTARGEAVPEPESWTVCMGDYTGEETEAVHAPEDLFEPGEYTLAAWSRADNITVSGTTATVSSASGSRNDAGAFIHNAPEWLHTSVQQVTIEKDRVHEFTAAMMQQVRQLTIVIEPKGDAAERITGIDAYLTGAAGTLDFSDGTHGSPANVELAFTKITEGENAGKWTATVRLLGVTGTGQRLKASIRFTDGNPAPVALDSDLTEALSGFNSGKTEEMILGGTLVETPTEASFTADITDWKTVEGDPVDAE
ncbi:MAG: FimB/Mfa2 family fimbrial subunit [Methanocorpusculum sp.]|nr:FimB/Mfa2 family fimbrial subunit [Methanocorpusculum sp.]